MVAKGGSPLLRDEARGALVKELIPLALVVTPNIPEAEILAGMRIATRDNMKKAAVKIHKLGANNVVVKGGHLDGDAMDLLFDGKSFHEFATKRIDTKHTHGTGCTFASAIATGLARGYGVLEAVKRAKDYVTEAIRFGIAIGGGQGPVNHVAPLLPSVRANPLRRSVEGGRRRDKRRASPGRQGAEAGKDAEKETGDLIHVTQCCNTGKVKVMKDKKTQLEMARKGIISEEMAYCAKRESVAPEFIRQGVEDGTIVVVRNNRHSSIPALAIGKGLRTKINANIGTSKDHVDLALELRKVKICAEAGADTIMDLSTGGDIGAIRKAVMKASSMAVGTVPIYQAAARP